MGLSIAKLRPEAEAYELPGVAEGLNCCAGAGGYPGRWVGAGLAGQGFDGEVAGVSQWAVMAGVAGSGRCPLSAEGSMPDDVRVAISRVHEGDPQRSPNDRPACSANPWSKEVNDEQRCWFRGWTRVVARPGP